MNKAELSTQILFIISFIYSVILFFIASGKSYKKMIPLIIWIFIQGILGWVEFYHNLKTLPALPVMAMPTMFFIVFLFNSKVGKIFIDSLDQKKLLLIHIVRIPVEIVLYQIYLKKMIPELMTFEGINFDIFAGLTAPIIYLLFYNWKILSDRTLLIWNVLSLGLLLNIVINAMFSAPGPLQLQSFNQPNIGMFHFPFMWLPSVIVPIVMLAHLYAIRYYFKKV